MRGWVYTCECVAWIVTIQQIQTKKLIQLEIIVRLPLATDVDHEILGFAHSEKQC